MNSVIELGLWQMLSAYIFVIILLIIVRIKGINREKDILISSLRMTLQLALVGYLLIYLFEFSNPLLTILVILNMEVFAIWTIIRCSKQKLNSQLKKVIIFSMSLGTLLSLFYFIFVVIRVSPWYDPRYFIPIAGMLIGNSMTGISLGVSTLVGKMEDQYSMVEAALMLGATPKMATQNIVKESFDSAIMPTINSMLAMGIVFLPGMMTGQILSGISPITAIEYQIAIMLGILGSVSLSVIIFVQLAYRTYFNQKDQLLRG